MKNKYQIEGDTVRIFLNRRNGKPLETIVSKDDFEKVNSFPNSWIAGYSKNTKTYYVQGNLYVDKKQKPVKLHRWIFDNPKGLVVDHINHDTLNNTRSNLRVISKKENSQNRKGARLDNLSSGVRNVYYHKRVKMWNVRFGVENLNINFGYFETKEEAERIADKYRKILMPFS